MSRLLEANVNGEVLTVFSMRVRETFSFLLSVTGLFFFREKHHIVTTTPRRATAAATT